MLDEVIAPLAYVAVGDQCGDRDLTICTIGRKADRQSHSVPRLSRSIARIVMRLINSVEAGQWRLMEPPAHSLSRKHAQFSRPSQEAPVSMGSFCEKGGQGWAEPRPCPERRETRCAERGRPGWDKGEDRPFLGGAKRIVPFVGIPEENTGHSREGGLERTRHLGSERQLELNDAVAEVIEIPVGNRR